MAEENKPKDVTVETFMGDMAKVIEGTNENGIIKKVIAENEKHKIERERTSPEVRINKIFLGVSIFLIMASLVAISLVFFLKEKASTVTVKTPYVSIILLDKTEFKEISEFRKEEIIQTILNEINTAEFKIGGIEGVYLTIGKKVVGFREFLNLMEANLDQKKIEFLNDNFLIGATNKETAFGLEPERNLFVLLKMRSIPDIFDPMRLWENKMFFDLHGLFGLEVNADTKYLLTKDFEDGIIQNKNARVLTDKDGKIVMMYVFAEEDSLIITNTEIAVKEVMLRLTSSDVRK